jgi:hypothetical protein
MSQCGLHDHDLLTYITLHMPKKFRLKYAFRNRRHIARNKWLFRTSTRPMNCPRKELLSGPALPSDQYRQIASGKQLRLAHDPLHLFRLGDNGTECFSVIYLRTFLVPDRY